MALKTLKNHPIAASLMRLRELLSDGAFQSPAIAFIELKAEQDKEEIRKYLISTYFGRPVDAHVIKTGLDAGSRFNG